MIFLCKNLDISQKSSTFASTKSSRTHQGTNFWLPHEVVPGDKVRAFSSVG